MRLAKFGTLCALAMLVLAGCPTDPPETKCTERNGSGAVVKYNHDLCISEPEPRYLCDSESEICKQGCDSDFDCVGSESCDTTTPINDPPTPSPAGICRPSSGSVSP